MQFFLLNEVRPQRSLKVTFIFTNPLFLRFIFCVQNLLIPKFGMNASIRKMQIFVNMKFHLMITLTYVLMDNFCPCILLKIIYSFSGILADFFSSLFINFKKKFLWLQTYRRFQFLLKWSMTSNVIVNVTFMLKVIQGYIRSTLCSKINLPILYMNEKY